MVYEQTRICLKNEAHEILWDFEIQMDQPISAGRPDLLLINKTKRISHLVDFTVPVVNKDKNWNKTKKITKLPGFCEKAEEAMEHNDDVDSNCSYCSWNSVQSPGKETEGIGNQMKNWDHPNY